MMRFGAMSLRKRIWTAPDGTPKQAWLVDYKDQAGKRRAKQFVRKKEAEAWLINAASEVQKGVHTPDSTSVTVERAAKLWLDSIRAADREPTTVAAYDQHVRLHIVPRCGAKKLSQLTAPTVRTLLDEWLKDLSRPMAVRVLRTFKAILTDAQERGLVAQNVALPVKVQKAKREKGKATPPTKEELRAILRAAEGSDNAMARAMVELVIFSGLRASELRGLSWRHLDLKGGRVAVEQRADAKGVIGPPKSEAGRRSIALPSRVVTALKQWKLACPKHELDLAFPSPKGKPLSHHVLILNYVGPVQIAAKVTKEELPKYGMHAFRHAAASLWIEQGLNPKRIQIMMGHGSIQVTYDTYGHLFEQVDRDSQEASAIERALFVDAT
jgi:integrase